MRDLIIDPPIWLYVVVSIPTLVCLWSFLRYQTRNSFLCLFFVSLLPIGLFIADRMFESPREEAVRRTELIVEAVNSRRKDKVLEHVSEEFMYRGLPKKHLSEVQTWSLMEEHNARIAVWDFDRDDIVTDKLPKEITIGFMGKEGQTELQFYIRATYVKDSDGKYRVKTFTIRPMLTKMNGEEIQVPMW